MIKKPGLILPRSVLQPQLVDNAEIEIFVPLDAVFPELEPTADTLIDLLKGLNRDEVLFACALINRMVTGTGDEDQDTRRRVPVEMFCVDQVIHLINAFSRQRGEPRRPTVFFRGQLLELVSWAVRYCERGSPSYRRIVKDRATSIRFVQAAMVAGELWQARVYADRLRQGAPVEDTRKSALGPFRRVYEDSAPAPHISTTLGRGWQMFTQHFPKYYPTFEDEFCAAQGLTVEQYFVCFAALTTRIFSGAQEGPLFSPAIFGENTAFRALFSSFFERESISLDELEIALGDGLEQRGLRALRDRPIIRLGDGNAVIIDPTLLSEKISIGPLFHLLAAARNNRKKPNGLFSAYGYAFEDYANGILNDMYPRGEKKVLVSRFDARVKGVGREGRAFEIDAILNDGDQIVLFEEKAAWLRDEMVLGSEDDWIKELRAKYGAGAKSPGGKQERDKGSAQLARVVRLILDRDCGELQADFDQVKIIRPVLLVQDVRLNAPLTAAFLADEFRDALGDVPAGIRVMPLAVLTIEDLENLHASVANFSMQAFLHDYAQAHHDGLVSLHNFMARDERYRAALRQSRKLIEHADFLYRFAHRVLYPPETPPAD